MGLFLHKIFGSPSQAALYEPTDPGIGGGRSRKATGDSYSTDISQRSAPASSTENGISPANFQTRKYGVFAKRRALKEAEEIVAKMERLHDAPDEAVHYFFKKDLPKLVTLSKMNPEKIHKLLQNPGPWHSLVQLACGDAQAFVQALENIPRNPAYLFALESVAAFRPREATHLLKQFFEKAELKNRMAAFRTAVVSQHLGDSRLIGEFFVKLMAATTSEEREEIVEPFLESLLQKSAATPGATSKFTQGKLAWLNAYCHGWMQEKMG